MIPQTVGREFDVGKIAPVQCVKDDALNDLDIKGHCFLLLIIHEGSAYFEAEEYYFEAVGPCLVCFDERRQPKLVSQRGLKCDSVYFSPDFLNINMTFDRVHSENYEQVATSHDMFLLRPFTDEARYVYPLPQEYTDKLHGLFEGLDKELDEQRDWYWSCRSRSFFMEMIRHNRAGRHGDARGQAPKPALKAGRDIIHREQLQRGYNSREHHEGRLDQPLDLNAAL